MAQCTVRLRKVPTKRVVAGRQKLLLTSDFGSMIGLDVSDTVVQTMGCELRDQESLGNEPTNLQINNGRGPQLVRTSIRPGTPGTKPSTLVFKATAFFGRADEMKKAAAEAYRMLRMVTRMLTGTAKQNFRVFVGRVGEDSPGRELGIGGVGISALNKVDLDADSTVSFVGPLTTYGRKLYWNPKGGKTVVRRLPGTRAASRKLGLKLTGGFIGSATMHQDVKKRLRRKNVARAFSVSDPFYIIPSGDIVGTKPETMKRPLRMPAITIQLKGRGRLR